MNIKADSLSYSPDDYQILQDVSFTLEPGRITLFLGKSGSGKTTILRILAGLIYPDQGALELHGERPGFVFQRPELFPHMTALDNCVHPQMIVKNKNKKDAMDRALYYFDLLGIESVRNLLPQKLSGGQQQRVSIARALCMNKKVLLFDEPTSALDPYSTKKYQKMLYSLTEQGITIAISTHDMPFAKECLDRAYLIDKGKIVYFYSKEQGDLSEASPLYRFLYEMK